MEQCPNDICVLEDTYYSTEINGCGSIDWDESAFQTHDIIAIIGDFANNYIWLIVIVVGVCVVFRFKDRLRQQFLKCQVKE